MPPISPLKKTSDAAQQCEGRRHLILQTGVTQPVVVFRPCHNLVPLQLKDSSDVCKNEPRGAVK